MAPEQISTATPVILKRIFRNGRVSVGVLIPPEYRRLMGLTINDYVGMRVRVVQGRAFLIIEKVALAKLAKPPELPVDVLPSER
jgi:hypothetical protein